MMKMKLRVFFASDCVFLQELSLLQRASWFLEVNEQGKSTTLQINFKVFGK